MSKKIDKTEPAKTENVDAEKLPETPKEQYPKSFKDKLKAFFITIGKFVRKIFSTLWRWIKRMFVGASKELSDDEKFSVESIESPAKMMVKSFFCKKIAVIALVLFVCMFLFVFIAPLFMNYDENYQDSNQKNIAPNFSMLRVSKDVAENFRSISAYSTFSIGLSTSGKISVWGDSSLGAAKLNIADIPKEVSEGNILFAAAGNDHAVAIDDKGKVHAWGISENGQYGENTTMPDTVDIAQVDSLVCGNQATAIVMKDGSLYLWGNTNTVSNLSQLTSLTNVKQIAFLNSTVVAILKDGTMTTGTKRIFTSVNGKPNTNLANYLADKEIVSVATTASTAAFLLNTNEIITSGNFNYGENAVPELSAGEHFVSVGGGNRHYVATTNKGNVYSWGSNYLGQCNVPSSVKEFDEIVVTSFQNYVIDNGKVVNKWGLRGYLFGTDEFGRDVFVRIVQGGKMTMTVGAVAVIVSSIIAIIIGCVSGYFGGWVDMLLMRITEIFSAIPFLPFAMMLSLVLRTSPISEEGRIFMIMVILGLLSWTGLARMIRGQVLSEREKEFVTAAKAMGVKESKIAFKHILPNVISVILVSMTLDFAGCMLTESSLSYLGFGVQPPRPTWGNMLTGANNSVVIQNYWWRWLFPSIFLAVATICINIIGDALRDVMDPKSGNER